MTIDPIVDELDRLRAEQMASASSTAPTGGAAGPTLEAVSRLRRPPLKRRAINGRWRIIF